MARSRENEGMAMTSTAHQAAALRVRSPLDAHDYQTNPVNPSDSTTPDDTFWERRAVPLTIRLVIYCGGVGGGLLGGAAAGVVVVYAAISMKLLSFQLLAAAYVALGVGLIFVVLCGCCGICYSRRVVRRRGTIKPPRPLGAARDEFAAGPGFSWAVAGWVSYGLTLALALLALESSTAQREQLSLFYTIVSGQDLQPLPATYVGEACSAIRRG